MSRRSTRTSTSSDVTSKADHRGWFRFMLVLVVAVALAISMRAAETLHPNALRVPTQALTISKIPRILVVDNFVDGDTLNTLETALPSASAMRAVDTIDKSQQRGAQRRTGKMMGFNGPTSEWPAALADLLPRMSTHFAFRHLITISMLLLHLDSSKNSWLTYRRSSTPWWAKTRRCKGPSLAW